MTSTKVTTQDLKIAEEYLALSLDLLKKAKAEVVRAEKELYKAMDEANEIRMALKHGGGVR